MREISVDCSICYEVSDPTDIDPRVMKSFEDADMEAESSNEGAEDLSRIDADGLDWVDQHTEDTSGYNCAEWFYARDDEVTHEIYTEFAGSGIPDARVLAC